MGLTSDTATDFGFNLGVLAKPSESWSVGASYRHKVKQDYAGAATFTLLPTGNTQFDTIVSQTLPSGAVPVTTSVTYPSLFSVGVAYKWNDWTFEGDANYYGWSSFDTLPITIENRPELSSIVEENYSNVWQFRFGAERVLNEIWSVRGGYFFDKTPSPVESVSPLLPDASRNGFAAGATWRSGRLRIDGASWYVKSKARSTEGVNRDQLRRHVREQRADARPLARVEFLMRANSEAANMRRVKTGLLALALASGAGSAFAQVNFNDYVSVGDSLAAGFSSGKPRGNAPDATRSQRCWRGRRALPRFRAAHRFRAGHSCRVDARDVVAADDHRAQGVGTGLAHEPGAAAPVQQPRGARRHIDRRPRDGER